MVLLPLAHALAHALACMHCSNLFEDELLDKCTPIRRQLLGDGVNMKGWWQPTEEDVPLKGWLDANRPGCGSTGQLEEGLTSPLIFADNHNSTFLPDRRSRRAARL